MYTRLQAPRDRLSDNFLYWFKLTPTEFEHLIRQLFEAIGMEAWNTQASKDEGVDAVAVSKDPVFNGECVIQAKRTASS